MRQEAQGQSIGAHPGKQEVVATAEPTRFQLVRWGGAFVCYLLPLYRSPLSQRVALPLHSISGTRPSASLSFPPLRVSASPPDCVLQSLRCLPPLFPHRFAIYESAGVCLCVFMLCLARVRAALQWRVLKGWESSQLAWAHSRSARMAKQGHAAEVNAVRIVCFQHHCLHALHIVTVSTGVPYKGDIPADVYSGDWGSRAVIWRRCLLN